MKESREHREDRAETHTGQSNCVQGKVTYIACNHHTYPRIFANKHFVRT